MAYNNTMNILILFGVTFVYSFFGVSNSNHLPYEAIFNFGDSISDTGNQASFYTPLSNSPYGSTYFKQPSGRFSDGRLIIDFIGILHLILIFSYTFNFWRKIQVFPYLNFTCIIMSLNWGVRKCIIDIFFIYINLIIAQF